MAPSWRRNAWHRASFHDRSATRRSPYHAPSPQPGRSSRRDIIAIDATLLIVIALIGVALVFDYINGFHDAANSIATVVATRVLTPGQAVVWAAVFNFVAAFGFGLHVAATIGTGTIQPEIVDNLPVRLQLQLHKILWNDEPGH